ncbi:MAG: polymerase sigma-B factor [Baekduia sp.]|jgi:RNA polymerase sigma-B factor|nr:polymerase sigma-B factor [Baekduia sp.]
MTMPASRRVRRPTGLRSARSDAHDAQILARFARDRDPLLREQLVRRYLPLARYAASRYARRTEPFDDLLQVACVGLLKAIDRYDPSRAVTFTSYALPTMMGELRRHFRDHGWAVRPPRDLQEQALAVERAAEELLHRLGRAPTIDELCAHTHLATEAVLEAREALAAHRAVSLSAPTGGGDGDRGDGATVQDRLGALDQALEGVEDRDLLEVLQRGLSLREREILRLRLTEDLTQTEIGRRLGLSQMHVSRLLRMSLEHLRREASRAQAGSAPGSADRAAG